MTDYHPVPCADHSRLELAIIRREALTLNGVNESGEALAQLRCTPLDIFARDGAEYLKVRGDDNQHHLLRLDRIHIEP